MVHTTTATLNNLRDLFYDVLREIADMKLAIVEIDRKLSDLQRQASERQPSSFDT